MVERGHAAFHLLLRIAFQQSRRTAEANAQHEGIIVLGLRTDGPVARREQHLDLRSAKRKLVAFPVAYDLDPERLRGCDHVLQSLTRWQQAYPQFLRTEIFQH